MSGRRWSAAEDAGLRRAPGGGDAGLAARLGRTVLAVRQRRRTLGMRTPPAPRRCAECGRRFGARGTALVCCAECRLARHRRTGAEASRRRRAADPEGYIERQREYDRRRRAADPERARKADRRKYWADPERAREAHRRWRRANPERVRQIVRESARRRRAADPERDREYQRRYRRRRAAARARAGRRR